MQMNGYYCIRDHAHDGPCPMVPNRATRFRDRLNASVDWILDIVWEACFDRH